MKNRLTICLIIGLCFLASGCRRVILNCPLSFSDQAYLGKNLLPGRALPGFHAKTVSQSYRLIAGPMFTETEKVYILTELWQRKKQKLTVSYHLYPQGEKAAAAYKNLNAGFPAGFSARKTPLGWETKTGGAYRLYTLKDRFIFILESPEQNLLDETAPNLLKAP